MSDIQTTQHEQKFQQPWWWGLQSGQALVEYWPTIPAAIMVMIVASAIAGPIGRIFHQTTDSLNMVVCGDAPPAYFTLPIGQVVEILGSSYDSANDRSTFTLSVPTDSQVVLGFDEAAVQRIAQASETYGSFGQEPTTGKTGITFTPDSSSGLRTSDAREITLTLTGEVDFVENLEVTVIDEGVVSSGFVYATITSNGENCANQSSMTVADESIPTDDTSKGGPKGNNGLGNGFDGQPPGNPPENDTCEDASPGNPCNKGGGDNDKGGPKGNNGVGNGFDGQPPGNPPENDTCEDAGPGNPCNKGGANKNK